jgi:hypothetical protein
LKNSKGLRGVNWLQSYIHQTRILKAECCQAEESAAKREPFPRAPLI